MLTNIGKITKLPMTMLNKLPMTRGDSFEGPKESRLEFMESFYTWCKNSKFFTLISECKSTLYFVVN